MRPPSILVLTTSYPSTEGDPSGIFIAKLMAALQRRGYRLEVLAPSDGTVYGRHAVHGTSTVRFSYFRPRSRERLTRGAGGIPENLKISRLARIQLPLMMLCFLGHALRRARRHDLIYANWLGAGIVGAAVHTLTGKPLVVSYRGDDGYLARDRFIWRFLARWVSSRASIVAPVSGEIARILEQLGVDESRIRVPQFGVDTEMFTPSEREEPEDNTVRLLFVGSLIPRKGLQDLLCALDDPGLDAVWLTVVGDGFDSLNLRRISEQLGLSHRIRWTGILPPERVAELMRNSDILCLPSYMEGRPNVVNEAMASGLPVITTRIGGIPDMVVEGETALLFDPGDVEALRTCLKGLVAEPDRRRRMGRAGREFIFRSGVSWDATAEEFDAIFVQAMKR